MTSSNGKIFRVTDPLYGEFTGCIAEYWWILERDSRGSFTALGERHTSLQAQTNLVRWRKPVFLSWKRVSFKVPAHSANEISRNAMLGRFRKHPLIAASVSCSIYRISDHMMTSSNGNIFRVTGHLCREFTDTRWFPRTWASDAELWYFLWCARFSKRFSKQWWASDLRRHRAHYDVTVIMRNRSRKNQASPIYGLVERIFFGMTCD